MPIRPPRPLLLQMHTVIVQPVAPGCTGRISCHPMGLEPIEFVWAGPNGQAVELDATRSEALQAVPGRYRICATDANGDRADAVVDVEPAFTNAVVVREYRVTHASTTHARDGSIVALGTGLDGPHGGGGSDDERRTVPPDVRATRRGGGGMGEKSGARVRFLWTNGVETDTPHLRDVPQGVYALTAILAHPSSGALEAPVTVHCCAPARVGIRGLG